MDAIIVIAVVTIFAVGVTEVSMTIANVVSDVVRWKRNK